LVAQYVHVATNVEPSHSPVKVKERVRRPCRNLVQPARYAESETFNCLFQFRFAFTSAFKQHSYMVRPLEVGAARSTRARLALGAGSGCTMRPRARRVLRAMARRLRRRRQMSSSSALRAMARRLGGRRQMGPRARSALRAMARRLGRRLQI